MNWHAVRAIYLFEMARTKRTLLQSVLAPVIDGWNEIGGQARA